jgi:hypothetical protein
MATRKSRERSIEPILLLRTESLSEGGPWAYQLTLDGVRAEASKSAAGSISGRENERTSTAGVPD